MNNEFKEVVCKLKEAFKKMDMHTIDEILRTELMQLNDDQYNQVTSAIQNK